MVTTPSNTYLLGDQINGGLWRTWYRATFIIICAQGFWTWHLSLSLECSSLLISDALTLTLIAFGGIGSFDLMSHVRYQTLPQYQPSAAFGSISGGHHIWIGSTLTWWGYDCGWSPWFDIGELPQSYNCWWMRWLHSVSLNYAVNYLYCQEMTFPDVFGVLYPSQLPNLWGI